MNASEAPKLAPQSCRDCPAWPKSAFAQLGPEALAVLAREKEPVMHERGQAFTVQGEPAVKAYCLCSGSAKVTFTHAPTRSESILRIVAPGDQVGYRCIFSKQDFRATASALEPTASCRISKATFLRLMEQDRVFALEMLRKMGDEIGAAESRLHSFCRKGARERTAEALLQLARAFGSPDGEEGVRFPLSLTRTDLANWVGTTKETMIRGLAEMREEGLLEEAAGVMHVRSIEKLRRLAEG